MKGMVAEVSRRMVLAIMGVFLRVDVADMVRCTETARDTLLRLPGPLRPLELLRPPESAIDVVIDILSDMRAMASGYDEMNC